MKSLWGQVLPLCLCLVISVVSWGLLSVQIDTLGPIEPYSTHLKMFITFSEGFYPALNSDKCYCPCLVLSWDWMHDTQSSMYGKSWSWVWDLNVPGLNPSLQQHVPGSIQVVSGGNDHLTMSLWRWNESCHRPCTMSSWHKLHKQLDPWFFLSTWWSSTGCFLYSTYLPETPSAPKASKMYP